MSTFKVGNRVEHIDSEPGRVGTIKQVYAGGQLAFVVWPDGPSTDTATLLLKPASLAPAPFKKGDRVVHDSFPDDVLDVLADQFTSGAVYIKWPDGSSRTVYNKVLTRIDPLPVDKTESIGSGNNRSTNPEPFKVGDAADGIYDVPGHGAIIAEIFDTGHVITTWPNGTRHVEEKRFLKHAEPFKHDNGGWHKAGPTPIINDTGASIQIIPLSAEDVVNHPAHYTSDKSGVECIQITRHRNFAIGSAIKYLWRAGLKQDPAQSDLAKEIEDLRKSIFYIQDEIARLEGES